jgi:hypothetical protein
VSIGSVGNVGSVSVGSVGKLGSVSVGKVSCGFVLCVFVVEDWSGFEGVELGSEGLV